MRHIPTSAEQLERLRKQAKKLKRVGGGKHADLLNKVARGAGYDHWHHALQCHERFNELRGLALLRQECDAIVAAEISGDIRVVLTGPQVGVGPFIAFSTGIGDAWLLDPEDQLAMCLVWRSQKIAPDLKEDPKRLMIGWHGAYEILGDMFRIESDLPEIGTRAVIGYPLEGIRTMIDKIQSFERKFDAVIAQSDAVDLTLEVIARLSRQGWSEETLRQAQEEGHRYSPSRNTMLTPVMSSDDFDEEDDDEDIPQQPTR